MRVYRLPEGADPVAYAKRWAVVFDVGEEQAVDVLVKFAHKGFFLKNDEFAALTSTTSPEACGEPMPLALEGAVPCYSH
jgi:hypothetical protein